MARQPIGGLPQELQTGIGEQGVRAAGGLEGMRNEVCEAFALEDWLHMHARLDAPIQGGIRGALQGLGEAGVAHEPDRHQIAGIETVVQEGRQVAEELDRQVLGLIEDPDRQQLPAVNQVLDAGLQVAPQLGAAEGGLDTQGQRQTAIEVQPPKWLCP